MSEIEGQQLPLNTFYRCQNLCSTVNGNAVPLITITATKPASTTLDIEGTGCATHEEANTEEIEKTSAEVVVENSSGDGVKDTNDTFHIEEGNVLSINVDSNFCVAGNNEDDDKKPLNCDTLSNINFVNHIDDSVSTSGITDIATGATKHPADSHDVIVCDNVDNISDNKDYSDSESVAIDSDAGASSNHSDLISSTCNSNNSSAQISVPSISIKYSDLFGADGTTMPGCRLSNNVKDGLSQTCKSKENFSNIDCLKEIKLNALQNQLQSVFSLTMSTNKAKELINDKERILNSDPSSKPNSRKNSISKSSVCSDGFTFESESFDGEVPSTVLSSNTSAHNLEDNYSASVQNKPHLGKDFDVTEEESSQQLGIYKRRFEPSAWPYVGLESESGYGQCFERSTSSDGSAECGAALDFSTSTTVEDFWSRITEGSNTHQEMLGDCSEETNVQRYEIVKKVYSD